jgi:hypothetical protein
VMPLAFAIIAKREAGLFRRSAVWPNSATPPSWIVVYVTECVLCLCVHVVVLSATRSMKQSFGRCLHYKCWRLVGKLQYLHHEDVVTIRHCCDAVRDDNTRAAGSFNLMKVGEDGM